MGVSSSQDTLGNNMPIRIDCCMCCCPPKRSQLIFGRDTTSNQTMTGDRHSMPEALRLRLDGNKASTTVYWSVPEQDVPFIKYQSNKSCGPMFCIPCAWPYLIIFGVPILCCILSQKSAYLDSAVVVTESSVEEVGSTQEVCCIPTGFCFATTPSSSTSHRFITDVKLNHYKAPFSNKSMSRALVLDGSMFGGGKHASTMLPNGKAFYGHGNLEVLQSKIMEARDAFHRQVTGGAGGTAAASEAVVLVGNDEYGGHIGGSGNRTIEVAPVQVPTKSTQERLAELQHLKDQHIITDEEYQTKRSKILADL